MSLKRSIPSSISSLANCIFMTSAISSPMQLVWRNIPWVLLNLRHLSPHGKLVTTFRYSRPISHIRCPASVLFVSLPTLSLCGHRKCRPTPKKKVCEASDMRYGPRVCASGYWFDLEREMM